MTTTNTTPATGGANNVTRIMLLVVLALVPGFAAHLYFFGWGLLINSIICIVTAYLCEAIMLRLRQRPLWPFLTDGSALVTALLLAAGLPALFPWWIAVIATAFAIIVAKHLYGGLGHNPFNPAMVGYALILIAFPKDMTLWLPTHADGNSISLLANLHFNLLGNIPNLTSFDAITMATPLDTIKTQLHNGLTLEQISAGHPQLSGVFYGHGWDWINGMLLLGGLFLLYQRVIHWRIPVSLLLSVAIIAGIANVTDSAHYAGVLFHVFGGATMLGAFFIATDPVTASTTPRGQIIYGCGIGILTYVIRTWGGYPDGLAFAVLLMNFAAPAIDYYTQPRVFGYK